MFYPAIRRIVLVHFLLSACSGAGVSQQSSMLTDILSSQVSTGPADVTLKGSATLWSHGKSTSGSIILEAMQGGGTLISLSFPSRHFIEVSCINAAGDVVTRQSTETDESLSKTPLRVDPSNEGRSGLLPVLAWFAPSITFDGMGKNLSSLRVSERAASSKSNAERRFRVQPLLSDDKSTQITKRTHLIFPTEVDLEPTTHLPTGMTFEVQATVPHPESQFVNTHPTLRQQVQYSEYQQTNGIAQPMYIKVLVEGIPLLEVKLETVKVNSGIQICLPSTANKKGR